MVTHRSYLRQVRFPGEWGVVGEFIRLCGVVGRYLWGQSGRRMRRSMDVLVSGATGLIGSALVPELGGGGAQGQPSDAHAAFRRGTSVGTLTLALSMGISRARMPWSISRARASPRAAGREEKKRRIMESRQKGTRLLAEKHRRAPGAALRDGLRLGDRVLRGQGKRVAYRGERTWGSVPLRGVPGVGGGGGPGAGGGIRVVHPRFGIVLSTEGGALGTTLPIFKLGGGGKIGSGRQYWTWVSLDDVIGAIVHALETEDLRVP